MFNIDFFPVIIMIMIPASFFVAVLFFYRAIIRFRKKEKVEGFKCVCILFTSLDILISCIRMGHILMNDIQERNIWEGIFFVCFFAVSMVIFVCLDEKQKKKYQ